MAWKAWTEYKPARLTAALLLGLSLGGCSLLPAGKSAVPPQSAVLTADFSVPARNIILPLPSTDDSERDQLLVVQLLQSLRTNAVTNTQRAELFYELGIIYDRLGLEGSARTMFMNALAERPDFGAAYNFLGIYLTLAGRFQDAYEAFDSALELDPRGYYAYLNRGIALYYGRRPFMGVYDLKRFFEHDHKDPYSMLWIYIAECAYLPSSQAAADLKARYDAVKPEDRMWGHNIAALYLGLISERDFIATLRDAKLNEADLAQRLCEAYFYLGKKAELAGKDKLAYDYYHLTIATRVSGFLEYRYALIEIQRLQQKYGLKPAKGEDELAD